MFNSTIFEVALGLVLIYLVLSLLVTSSNEFIAQLLSLRAENLAESIHGLFPGPDRHRFADDILRHPLVYSLSRKQFGINMGKGPKLGVTKYPSTIPEDIFAAVVLDLRAHPKDGPYDPETFMPLDAYAGHVAEDGINEKAAVAAWFRAAMERARGWYKRKIQVLSFLVAFGLALSLNGDTLVIADRLSNSPTERAKIAAFAKQVESNNGSIQVPKELKGATLSFLGWERSSSSDPRRAPRDGGEWFLKLMGLAMTAIAASLGAPFWFDVLSKIMTVRSGGDPPLPKQEPAPAKTETHKEGATK